MQIKLKCIKEKKHFPKIEKPLFKDQLKRYTESMKYQRMMKEAKEVNPKLTSEDLLFDLSSME